MRKPTNSSPRKNTTDRKSSEGMDRSNSFDRPKRESDRPSGNTGKRPRSTQKSFSRSSEKPLTRADGSPTRLSNTDRSELRGSGDRFQSNDRPNRREAGSSAPRFQRDDRPERRGPGDRFQSNDRPERREAGNSAPRFQRDDRPERRGPGDRFQSNDRPNRREAGNSAPRFQRDDRPERRGPGDRFQPNDRPERREAGSSAPRFQRDDRPERRGPSTESSRFSPRGSSEKRTMDRAEPRFNRSSESGQPDTEKKTSGGFGKRAPTVRTQEEITLDHSRRVDTGGKPTYEEDRIKKSLPPRVKAKLVEDENELIRLNKYISNAGLCSRREADELIASGQIRVNGQVITELGYKVQPTDNVTYGRKVLNKEKLVYLLLNKPKDYITTTEDPEDRKTVMDLVGKACKERIYPVGRLDRNTTGLLLLTNDGELAEKLSHPGNNMKKVYQAELDKPITIEHFEQIKAGLELEDGFIKPDDLGIVTPDAEVVGIEIHSGKNRIVRRIFEHLGYEVLKLDRTVYAGLTKKDLPRGMWRFLTEKEVIRLKYMM